jgi:glycosyltransferase involved in cell wall biosynthesis
LNTPASRVTIITACRNAVRTIEETILSVVNQDYGNIEYIIVDADSDDGTADIIERYRTNVALWIREPDNGIADAWNKGIRHATGEIIGIINADDYYLPGTVTLAVDALRKNPGYGFICGDLQVLNQKTGKWHTEKGRDNYEGVLRYEMSVLHPTVFARKEIYDSTGLFDSRFRIALDYEFMCRLASKGVKGRYIPRIFTAMRQGGLSDVQRIATFVEVRKISVICGSNRFLAAAYFWFKVMRTYLGQMIDRLGIDVDHRRIMRLSLIGLLKRIAKKLPFWALIGKRLSL